jgi:hypothetical protein
MRAMGGRRATWLLLLPLAAVGWLTAHWLAYVLIEPDAHHRARLLSEAGHGYLGAVPAAVACAGTLAITGFAIALHDGLRHRERARVPVWPVALVPPLGFAVQEHLERLIERHAFPVDAALEPTFLAGMALQLPFALGALLLVRAVLALGHLLGRGLTARRSPRPLARALPLNPPGWVEPELARPPILATGHSERGPPVPALG